MFNFLPVLLALVALARAICMYDCEPIYTIRSDPFNLVLVSEDASLNGTTLSICHSGAVIWTLCPTHSEDEVDDPVVLYHNSTDTAITNDFGTQGILAWYMPYYPYPIPFSVLLQPQDFAALAIAQLAMTFSGDGKLSFDKNDVLNYQNQITWDAERPARGEWKGYNRWWVCFTFYGTGYARKTLVWGTGAGKPDPPSCVKVEIKRVFIGA